MELDPEIRAIVDGINASGAPEYCDMSPEEARASHNDKASVLGAPFVDLPEVRDFNIDGSEASIPVRLYKPTEASGPQPGVVFYHGGGHVVGSLDSYDTLCRQLAIQSGACVASVDYRLAPEHRFPAAVVDAYDAWSWFVSRGESVGIDPGRLAVAGDSAGGNLAAVVTQLVRDADARPPVHQLLVYPATAAYPDSASQLAFAEKHILTRRLILWFHDHYLDYAKSDHTDPRWAPLMAADFTRLPDATIILAGCDPLRDEGLDYAQRLVEAGGAVTTRVYKGAVHPFFSWSGKVTCAKHAVSFAAQQLADALGIEGSLQGR